MRIPLAFLILISSAAAAYGQITAVNGASFLPGEPVAPGSFATVFGENLCGSTAAGEWTAPGRLPTLLGGCSISVNGAPAMMAFASPTQINFIVPPEAGMGRGTVTVTNGTKVNTGSIVIGRAAPGIFSMNGLGMGDGAILHAVSWTGGPFSVTTNGQPTPVAIFVTGLDLATKPVVTVGGVPVEVVWFGTAPGFTGLQQINFFLPATLAGAGRVPVTVTSGGQTSNVCFINILPTEDMMRGMPGWDPGKHLDDNKRRGQDMSYMALNAVKNTILVTDEDDDAVRVISLDTRATLATITLPEDSEPRHVAVNADGTLGAVVLNNKDAVVFIDLANNKALSVVKVGSHPMQAAFAGSNLLVTNGGSGSVTVIEVATAQVTRTVQVGYGPAGIAVNATQAIVANMQAGSVSLIDLATWAVTNLTLPGGLRPHEVAVAGTKAVITNASTNSFLLLDLGTKQFTVVETGGQNAMGPGAIAVKDNLAFIANQMTSSVTVVNTTAAAGSNIVKTFTVDPGPRALAAAKGFLVVLCEGTNTVDLVDYTSYAILARINAAEAPKQGRWQLPVIASITPATAAAGSTVTIMITGSNFQGVKGVAFYLEGAAGNNGQGQGRMRMNEDTNIVVTNVTPNSDGTQITAKVEVKAAAVAGGRQLRLETADGQVAGPAGFFTVTK